MNRNLLRPKLITKEYRTLTQIRGPLIFIERTSGVAYHEMVEILDPDGTVRLGRVLEVDGNYGVVQVFIGTAGLDLKQTRVRFRGDVARLDVSLSMLGRVLDGTGQPIDGGPPIIPEASLDINGARSTRRYARTPASSSRPIRPSTAEHADTRPEAPIFSCAGLPANERPRRSPPRLASATPGRRQRNRSRSSCGHWRHAPRGRVFHGPVSGQRGDRAHGLCTINRADDPSVLRLLTARAALTAAEYLAFAHQQHVLVIMTDMTNYCEALRESRRRAKKSPPAWLPGLHVLRPGEPVRARGPHHGNAGSVTRSSS